LTFFSRTIFDFNLASVVVDYAREGAITRSADGKGIVDFAVKDAYYAAIPGKIYLQVSQGETVSPGQVLYSIVADLDDLRQKLDELKSTADSLNLRLQKAKGDTAYAQSQLSNLKNGKSDYDTELAKLSLSINAAEKESTGLKALLEAGAIPEKEVNDKQAALDNLRLQYRQQEEKKQKAGSDLEKSITDFQYQIDEYELQSTSGQKEIDRLAKQLNDEGEITTKAESGGVVREISGTIDNGAFIGQNQPVLKIGVTGSGFKTTFQLPESVNYLSIGDGVSFNIDSRSLYNINGQIIGLVMEEGYLQAEVQFAADNLSGGEATAIKVRDTSELYPNVLPNNVIHNDDMGDYVLYAEMSKGFWGNEYYARKLKLSVQAHNNYSSAVRFHSYDENIPVIVSSDKMVFEGDKIRIVGGSDLIEIR